MAHSAGRVHNERHLKKSLDEELSMTVKKYDDNDAAPTHPTLFHLHQNAFMLAAIR